MEQEKMAPGSADTGARIKERRAAFREIAEEGIVLLLNMGILPLEDARQAALFGRGMEKEEGLAGLEEGLLENGIAITSEHWLEHCKKEGDAEDVPLIKEEDLTASDRDIAVLVISRPAKRGKKSSTAPWIKDTSAHQLSENEKSNIALLSGAFRRFVVILCTDSYIDTSYLRKTQGIGAVLLAGSAGEEAGNAMADVLCGKTSPSGHLECTWPESIQDFPASGSGFLRHMLRPSGDGKASDMPFVLPPDVYYTDGIYVGYRYFDTFNVTPAYPFGYGLTYGRFTIDYVRTVESRGIITVFAFVTNRGEHAAKASVQVYVCAPQGKIAKPYQELRGFWKTGDLAPQEKCEVSVSFPFNACASYDETRSAYILEEGVYYIRLGENSRDARTVSAITLDREIVVERLRHIQNQDAGMGVISANGALPFNYADDQWARKTAAKLTYDGDDPVMEDPDYTGISAAAKKSEETNTITLDMVEDRLYPESEMISQLENGELADLLSGGDLIRRLHPDRPDAFSEGTYGVSRTLERRHVRTLVMADVTSLERAAKNKEEEKEDGEQPGRENAKKGGPVLFSATFLSRTWNRALAKKAGDIAGKMMESCGTDLLLVPCLDIKKQLPGENALLCASEDPLLSGSIIAEVVRGIQEHPGKGAVIGRFALGCREGGTYVNIHVTERALREIYLKSYEICVREGDPFALETAQNVIGGVYTGKNRDLLTLLLRDEWKFDGAVLVNTRAKGQNPAEPGECLKEGSDLVVPGGWSVRDALTEDKKITRGELERAAGQVLKLVMRADAGNH